MKHRAGGKNYGVVVDAERLVERAHERMKNERTVRIEDAF